jgi:hypothetical protein
MKIAIISPDENGTIDGVVHNILQFLPNKVEYINDADVVIVPITRLDNFKFAKNLHRINKPWVLVDFCEYGWDWKQDFTHYFGFNTQQFGHFKEKYNDEWETFDNWVQKCPPIAEFKRELVQASDHPWPTYPIEYPCLFTGESKPQSKEEYLNRPIEVMYFWGRSHEERVSLHAKMFNHSRNGIELVSRFEHIEPNFNDVPPGKRRVWCSILQPHYDRIDIGKVMRYNGMAKLSISYPGAGVKCFRHSEVTHNSLMVLPHDNLQWSYPWIDGENCVRVNFNTALNQVEDALHWDKLYDTYVAGLETNNKYRIQPYISDYIIPTIQKHL